MKIASSFLLSVITHHYYLDILMVHAALNFDYLDFLTSPNNSQVPTMSMKSSASSSNSFSPKQVRFGHKNRGKHEAIFQKEADKEGETDKTAFIECTFFSFVFLLITPSSQNIFRM